MTLTKNMLKNMHNASAFVTLINITQCDGRCQSSVVNRQH